MAQTPQGQPTFDNLGIARNLLQQIAKLNFVHPTPIQVKAIPVGVKGDDIIGIAQTGTGKTLAFAIPMLQKISSGRDMGLVLLPTRELALQVEAEVSKLGRYFGVKTAVLIGGASMNVQLSALRRNPNVIIATPGRLNDHLQQKTVSLSRVRFLVLDEADRMLDMGFEPQIRKILALVPRERQTFLFSATMPAKIAEIAKKYMQLPVRVEVAPSGTAAELVEQEAYLVQKNDKLRLLVQLLSESEGTALVFSRTKYGAKKITSALRRMGESVAEIHSNRSQSQRREALDGFKSGKYRVLIATDIASRGIDVTDIKFVINFDLPTQAEDYVHRIGRTGRAGKTGKAISFVMPEQKRDVADIERLIRGRLKLKPLPELPEIKMAPLPERGQRRPWGQSSGRPLRGRGQPQRSETRGSYGRSPSPRQEEQKPSRPTSSPPSRQGTQAVSGGTPSHFRRRGPRRGSGSGYGHGSSHGYFRRRGSH